VAIQPVLHTRQGLAGEPFAVDMGKLADEGKQRDVRNAARSAAQIGRGFQPRLQRAQQGKRFGAVVDGVGCVAAGIFGTVEVVLERAVIDRDQRRIVACQPALGIALRQRPAHDGKAFVDHGAVCQPQHRHSRLGRGLGEFGRLGSELHLAQFDRNPRHPQGHARPHRIGAAAEGIEDRPGLHARAHSRGGSTAPTCSVPRFLASASCRWRSA
jgi:hypothetical protein